MFRVGEIVFHREYEVRGVVLGWDSEAKAPLTWLRQVYSEDQTSLYIDPHYTVICDTNQVTIISDLDHYIAIFYHSDGGRSKSGSLLCSIFPGQ